MTTRFKRQANNFGEVLDYLWSDVDWITKREKYDGLSNFDFLSVVNSATQRKNDEEDESDKEKVFDDARMQSHGIKDDLKIYIDVNLENSRKFKLNNIGNTGIDNSSNTNVHNIGVGTNSDTNNLLNGNDFDECLMNNEKDEGNEASFSLQTRQ